MDNFFLIIGVVLVVLVALYIKTYTSKKAAPNPTPAPAPNPAPVASGGTAPPALPAGIDVPDANGFVALTGLPAGNYYNKIRFSVSEVGAALSGVQHASVALNSGFLANGRWITSQMIGVCAEIESVTDGTNGAVTYRLKSPEVSIPNTLALPPSFTVASATAHFAALPDPNTQGNGGFVPKH